jgi:hypothetical protein
MENSQCQVKIQADLSDPLITMSGLRQGDFLVCLLSNKALEKVIIDAGIQTRGTIFYKYVQLFAYTDGIDINGRSEHDIKENFYSFENCSRCYGTKCKSGKDQIHGCEL